MKIAGLEKNSFVDYPGRIAAVVFTPGCNLNCYYCHNRMLLLPRGATNLIPIDDVMTFLIKRRGFLDGVVITGGEPTLQNNLEGFIRDVKELGYSIKLDTNGTNPRLLKKLLGKELLDYIAMDVKAPFHKYKELCGVNTYMKEIEESIKLLLSLKTVEYEFRTTLAPGLTQDDILEIAAVIAGAELFVLQQYRLPQVKNGFDDPRLKQPPYSPVYLRETASRVSGMVKRCVTRGI